MNTTHMNTTHMNANTHPIDLALAGLLVCLDAICWLINETLGHHAPLTAETVDDPRDTIAIEAPVHDAPDLIADLHQLSVVELRRMARGLAKGIHMMRKAELVALLA